jgi:PAS domain S-box-containing protein
MCLKLSYIKAVSDMRKSFESKKLGILKSDLKHKKSLPHASVKEAVQQRVNLADRSSIIPGIDINELKRSLDLLKYALDYSEAIVDTVREPLVVLDKNSRILTANKSFYETFRLNPKDTENKLIYEIGKNQWNVPKLKILLEKILPKNTHFENFEVEYNLPYRGIRIFLLSARRTYRQVNETEAILLAFEDITDRKYIERQKDDFIGNVSHELKNPLTSIQGYSQILKGHLKHENDVKGGLLLDKIDQQIHKLRQLMASFTDVYNIQTGKLKLQKSLFSIADLVGGIVADFQFSTKTHEIVNKVNTNKEVFADKKRITQVFVNVISNAMKYSPNAKKIVITSIDEANRVIICVQDFGIGVPPEEHHAIFDRFYRVKNNQKVAISGLGLGLYISSEIMKQHKGEIWVKSTYGNGASFYVSLPIAD